MARHHSRRPYRSIRSGRAAAAVCLTLWVGVSAQAQLRVVSYNTLDKPVTVADEADVQTIFGAIATESVNGIARPADIVLLQEQTTFSFSTSTMQTIADSLNVIHGTSSYEADFVGFGNDRLAVVYNSATVDLLDSASIGVGIRPGYRGHFRPVGYTDPDTDFYAYSVHFKAGSTSSDFSARTNEAINLTNNGDSLGEGTNIIYAGDFNLQQGSDAAYQNMIAAGPGQAVDPTGVSNWNGFFNPEIMTQSTRTSSLADGGAPGGNDDRFDFQFVSGEVNDGEGFAIITPTSTGAAASSYRAFGNDGVSFNQAINNTTVGRSQPAAVLNALHDFSDHLPVIADYQLPALMQIGATPTATQAFVGEAAIFSGSVQNIAPVSVAAGADELDYSATASGDVAGAGTFVDTADPLDTANTHGFSFNTATAGQKSASFDVTSLSQGVADQQTDVSIDVFDHANGSFDSGSDLNTLTINFGSVSQDAGGGAVSDMFSISNLLSTAGFTSALSITEPTSGTGDDNTLFIDLSLGEDVVAGDDSSHTAILDTSTAGVFSATWEIVVGDALDIAGALSETLTLNLLGEVVGAGFIDGDYNGDGFVSQADLDLVLLNWGDSALPSGWAAADQFDGVQISQNELDGVLLNWGDGTPPAVAVPEPATAVWCLIVVGGLGRRAGRFAIVR